MLTNEQRAHDLTMAMMQRATISQHTSGLTDVLYRGNTLKAEDLYSELFDLFLRHLVAKDSAKD